MQIMKKDSFYSTFKMASGMIAVLVALSLMVGGRSVHAQTEVSANASVHLDASGNSAAATVNASATPRLDAIKAHAAEVKDAARENADIHANATTSTEIRAAVSAFLAKLKTDRTAAIAELKQNVATFKTRLQNWHGKLLGANTEKKVALDAAARVRVGTALDVIIARFKGIASTMDM